MDVEGDVLDIIIHLLRRLYYFENGEPQYFCNTTVLIYKHR